jgi:hypothetical protein
MLLKMMSVAILSALFKLFYQNWVATPEVTISTETTVITALSAGIVY